MLTKLRHVKLEKVMTHCGFLLEKYLAIITLHRHPHFLVFGIGMNAKLETWAFSFRSKRFEEQTNQHIRSFDYHDNEQQHTKDGLQEVVILVYLKVNLVSNYFYYEILFKKRIVFQFGKISTFNLETYILLGF